MLKRKLKFLLKWQKQSPKCLLRPHPSEKENLERLKKLFKKLKNVEVNLDGDLYNCILNLKLVIFGPSSSIIDSLILETLNIWRSKKSPFSPYGVHPTINWRKVYKF